MSVHMQRVAGLIVSLPTTRIAIITRRVNGVCIANTASITATGKRAETLEDQCLRVATATNEILHAVGYPAIVVIQGATSAARSNSLTTGLWWHTVVCLMAAGFPVAEGGQGAARQSPGDGLASVITPLWPQTRLSAPQEATALALAHMGALRLGWDVPVLRGEGLATALGTVTWPDATSGTQGAVSHVDPSMV